MKKLLLIVSLILYLAFPVWAEHPGAYGSGGSTPGGASGSVQCNASGVLGACINLVDTMTPTFTSVTATNYYETKVPTVAGLMAVYNAATTSTLYMGWMGSATLSRSYAFQFPSTEPTAGQVMAFGAPAGTGDPNNNPIAPITWVNMGSGMVESRGAIFDGGGSVIANGKIVYIYFPYGGTISKVTTLCNAADSTLALDILRLAYSAGNTLPTVSMIGSGNYPTPTTAESQITPNGSWTSKAIVAGDVLAVKVTNVAATAVWCNVAIDVTR